MPTTPSGKVAPNTKANTTPKVKQSPKQKKVYRIQEHHTISDVKKRTDELRSCLANVVSTEGVSSITFDNGKQWKASQVKVSTNIAS